MYLSYACRSEWIEVDLSKLLLPFTSIFLLKNPHDLFDWHDVRFRTSTLHGLSDHRRYNRLLASREDLAELENSSSHLSEGVRQFVNVARVDSILLKTLLALLLWTGLTHANLLFKRFFNRSTNELDTKYAKLESAASG